MSLSTQRAARDHGLAGARAKLDHPDVIGGRCIPTDLLLRAVAGRVSANPWWGQAAAAACTLDIRATCEALREEQKRGGRKAASLAPKEERANT